MNQAPLVSVIIPTYNASRFLREAIASVQQQRLTPLEIILVDDGSTDDTATMSAAFEHNVHYVFQNNRGPAAARNTGLNRARANLFAFLDADDLWTDNKLPIQLQRLQAVPSVDIVMGYTQRVKEVASEGGKTTLQNINPVWMAFLLGSGLFQRSVFDKVGLFDETLRFGEDVDWFLRARELGVSIDIVNEVVHLYRIHEGNMTHDTQNTDHFFLRALKQSLDRRRMSGAETTPLTPVPGLVELNLHKKFSSRVQHEDQE